MCMTLGGRVAEAIKFRKVTSGTVLTYSLMRSLYYSAALVGAKDDLEKVTDMAYRQVSESFYDL